jgi:sugar lactone lactonase YvrE
MGRDHPELRGIIEDALDRPSLTRRQIFVGSTKLAVGGALALTFGQRAMNALAQQASPVAGPPLPPGCTVVASGLINPRYVAIADDGTLYVSEAGSGGDETINAPAAASPVTSAATPVAQPLGTRGTTGQVSKITPDGAVSVVASGLPSYNVEGPVGPAGIVFADGQIWLAIGGAGPITPMVQPLPNENSVVKIDPANGNVTKLADIGEYERQNNPQPDTIDSNVYGLARGADGTLYAADAGGNALYSVNPTTNELTLLGVIADIPLPPAPATPVSATPVGAPEASPTTGPSQVQAVPTGVAVSPDGAIYVGELTGAPFIQGLANVLQLQSDGSFTPVGTNLTMVVGVAVGPDGNLYASELSLNFLAQPPALGRVVRIGENGNNDVVVDGLPVPNGIAFDKDGNLYVVANTVGQPGAAPNGQLLRCDGIAAPGGMATPTS